MPEVKEPCFFFGSLLTASGDTVNFIVATILSQLHKMLPDWCVSVIIYLAHE